MAKQTTFDCVDDAGVPCTDLPGGLIDGVHITVGDCEMWDAHVGSVPCPVWTPAPTPVVEVAGAPVSPVAAPVAVPELAYTGIGAGTVLLIVTALVAIVIGLACNWIEKRIP